MSKYDIFSRLMKENSWEEFEQFVIFNYFNNNYSIFNSALILLQKPGATEVKTEARWNEEGRFIKPEASPMLIMQPRGPVMPVYDRSDTYSEKSGKEDEYDLISDFRNRTKLIIDKNRFAYLVEKLDRSGIIYRESDFGERLHGKVTALEAPQRTYYTKIRKNGDTETIAVDAYFQITINSALDPHSKALTLLHELGHLYCGHIAGGKRTPENRLPEYCGEGLDRDTMEYEAETVCKIICERNDFSDNCEDYLKQHMKNGTVPPYNKTAVFRAVDKVRSTLNLV